MQIGAFFWPALLPDMIPLWKLSNSEAGWITASFYGAYMISVPVLVTLTDRVDPKHVYLFGVGATVLGYLMFALLADGFWSALAMRALAGMGWAGTYMTGLKLLADRVDAKMMSRATGGHAASIGVSGALSFACGDLIAAAAGWQAAFLAAAVSAGVAWLSVALIIPAQSSRAAPAKEGQTLYDFRPVFRNKSAMAYAIAYSIHTLEMSAVRGWGVAFLGYVAMTSGASPAAVLQRLSSPDVGSSVPLQAAGNEAAIRFGRKRLVVTDLTGWPRARRAWRVVGIILFALIMSLNGFVFGVISIQLVPLLEAAGLAGATAVWVASLKGHGQFAGRLVEIFLGRNLKAITIARIAIAVLPASLFSALHRARRALAAGRLHAAARRLARRHNNCPRRGSARALRCHGLHGVRDTRTNLRNRRSVGHYRHHARGGLCQHGRMAPNSMGRQRNGLPSSSADGFRTVVDLYPCEGSGFQLAEWAQITHVKSRVDVDMPLEATKPRFFVPSSTYYRDGINRLKRQMFSTLRPGNFGLASRFDGYSTRAGGGLALPVAGSTVAAAAPAVASAPPRRNWRRPTSTSLSHPFIGFPPID